MRYRNFYNRSYQNVQVRKDPGLGARLNKILNEDLNDASRNFVSSLSDFYNKNGGKVHERWKIKMSPTFLFLVRSKMHKENQQNRNRNISNSSLYGLQGVREIKHFFILM